MPDFLRRRMWRACVATFVLATAVSSAALMPCAEATTQSARDGDHRAVWRVIDENRKYQASAFAVGPRLVVTVAHYLFDVLKAGSEKMVLVQAGRNGHINVVRARSISTTHDLALLETTTTMEHHLTVVSALPHGLADQFHAAGYPAGQFETVSVIAQTLHGDVDYLDLPMDRIVPSGMSGSPVLAPNGEVIAMLRTANANVTGGVRAEFLKRFMRGDLGVSCGALSLKACLDKATAQTKRLAEEGGIAAQYQLGREHRYIPGDSDIGWLRRAAEEGHARAQRELGNALYDGARGLIKNWRQSNYWMQLAAEDEDSTAQLNLSIAYLFGEGVATNIDTSMHWLLKALGNGHVGAEYNLGLNYFEGEGLTLDKGLGRYWLRRAAERGYDRAREYLKEHAD